MLHCHDCDADVVQSSIKCVTLWPLLCAQTFPLFAGAGDKSPADSAAIFEGFLRD